MGWADRLSQASIRLYEATRSDAATDAAEMPPTGSMRSLEGQRYALVVTFRRTGEPVPTPVWFGLDAGRLYFRSVATGHKLRRIAHTPRVLVAPCTGNGRPTGPAVAATARILNTPADEATAESAISANNGLARRVYARLIGPRVPGVYVEVLT